MSNDPVNSLLTQGKHVLRQVVVRSAITFVLAWAFEIVLVMGILLERSWAMPTTSTWMFVVGVTALPATVAGQVAGVVTILIALTQLAGNIARLPQMLMSQLATGVKSEKSLFELAPLARKGGLGSQISVSLLSALGVALMSTLVTAALQLPGEKPRGERV
jgi:hypothetical protein